MPYIIIKAPEGVFDTAELGRSATAVAKTVEQGGDEPRHATLTWVQIETFKPGAFFAGAADPLGQVIPVVVLFHYPDGVLDQTARTDAARLFQDAFTAARPAGDPRPVRTSVIMTAVPEGTWGGNGQLWSLPDLAKAAGFKHLQHLVAA